MRQELFSIPDAAPKVGAIYTHFKNPEKLYQVIGISLNSDSDEYHVEYIPLYEGAVALKFNRSITSWNKKATLDGKEVTRYQFIRIG